MRPALSPPTELTTHQQLIAMIYFLVLWFPLGQGRTDIDRPVDGSGSSQVEGTWRHNGQHAAQRSSTSGTARVLKTPLAGCRWLFRVGTSCQYE